MDMNRPIDEQSIVKDISNISRVGNIGEKPSSNWDNGFYVNIKFKNVYSKFLIDSGSTLSLVSKDIYDKLEEEEKPSLNSPAMKIHDVTGDNLHTYGQAEMKLNIGNKGFDQTVIVCDMSPEGILGQDFLMNYVQKIDYSRQLLHTDKSVIQCWTGGESAMVCRVLVEKETVIPGNSASPVPVDICNTEHLAPVGFVHSSKKFMKPNVCILDGLIDTRCKEESRTIRVINQRDEPVTLYPRTEIGVCESIYSTDEGQTSAVRSVLREETVEKKKSVEIPEHLQELINSSSKHLDVQQRQALTELIVKYESVFSKSSEDLGFTDKVKHHVEVGNARPIKQAPRRLPFGKRESEKEEIQKMLNKG